MLFQLWRAFFIQKYKNMNPIKDLHKNKKSKGSYKIVYVLVLIYLYLTTLTSVGMGPHVLNDHHKNHSGHAMQHHTWFCHWACTALFFVHTAAPLFGRFIPPTHEMRVYYQGTLFSRNTQNTLTIRGPPILTFTPNTDLSSLLKKFVIRKFHILEHFRKG